jgi:hypothetical protein
MKQTIKLPSGSTITIEAKETRPLSEWTDVEICERIASLRNERRKVQGHYDEEATHARVMVKKWTKRLRAELARRKREGEECPACDGMGSLGIDPDGDRCYCDGCEYGLTLQLGGVCIQMGDAAQWLQDREQEEGWGEAVLAATREKLERLTQEFDELTAKLALLKANAR